MENKWIPVTERLPKENCGEYLIVVNGIYRFERFERAVEIAVYDEEEGWVLEAYPNWQDPIVTHWMPLPEPPKEGI